MDRWEDEEELLLALAADDLELGEELAAPCLVAYAGEQLVFRALLRSHAKGDYQAPITELVALAAPLDADRYLISCTARIWSLDEPPPEVTEDRDPRQRVVVLEQVDASRGRPRSRTVLVPFDPPALGEPVCWGPRQVHRDSEGWISATLALAASERVRGGMRTTEASIAAQAERIVALGHGLLLAPDVAARLRRAREGYDPNRCRPHPTTGRASAR